MSFQNGKKIDSRFVLTGDRLSFVLDAYDNSQPITIDPNRIWGTYYGGADDDNTWSCTADSLGNIYMAGVTESSTAIASAGHQNIYGGGDNDAYLVKFNTNGVRQWATYYGGASLDWGFGCAVDGSGNVYLSGTTESDTAIAFGGHQNTFVGSYEAFLVKFNSNGIRQWGTYYGTLQCNGESCAVDDSGNVYLSGETNADTAIASGGSQNTCGGGCDAFLVKFNASGVRQWGTYYGGNGDDQCHSCAVDASSNVYLAGQTISTNGIAFNGFQSTFGGGSVFSNDAFLVKFDANGVRPWGTYYGGTENDYGWSCAVDGNDNVYLAGWTGSNSGIAFGGHQNTLAGVHDAFLVKFNAGGARQWATYYGGTGGDDASACASDDSDNVYLAGSTQSIAAIAFGGYQNTYGGMTGAYLVKFNTGGVRQWATYYGGSSDDEGYSCAVDGSGNVYLAGTTISSSGIAYGGHQNTFGGYNDAFLVKFDGLPVNDESIFSLEDRLAPFSIWPNPNAGDRFSLRTQGTGPAEVQIFDALGQLQRTWHMRSIPGQAPAEIILGGELPKGMYFVRCTVDGWSSTAPLMIQ